jgi:hypothetical protein
MVSRRPGTISRHVAPPNALAAADGAVPASGLGIVYGDTRPRIFSAPKVTSTAGTTAINLAASAGLMLDDWEAWVLDQALGEDDARWYTDPATQEEKPLWAAFEVGLIVSRQNGKGSILEARELAGLFAFDEQLIIHTAHEFKTCNEAFRRLLMLIENTPDFDRRVSRVRTSHGEEGIELVTGQRIRFLARSQSSGRGFTGDLLIYDEAMILDAAKVGATLPVLSARPNPQVWYTASAGLRISTQLAKVRRRGVAGGSKGLCFMEWSASVHDEYCPPKCGEHLESTNVRALQQANPGLGIRISLDHCEREREGMDYIEFARERLGVGQYPAPADAWAVIPEKWWKATLDTDSDTVNVVHGGSCMGVALGYGRTSASIAVAGARDDGNTQVEVIEHKHGIRWLVDRARVLDKKHKPEGWVIDPHADEGSLADELEQEGLNVIRMTATDVGHAFGQIYDGFREGTVRHPNQPEVQNALAGSEKRKLGNGQAWDRLGVQVDLSPIIAVTHAHWGYLKYGRDANYPIEQSVDFDLDTVIRMIDAGYYGTEELQRLSDEGAIPSTPDAWRKLVGRRTIPALLRAHAQLGRTR